MENEMIQKIERLLDSVCGTYEDDCTKCPYKEMCDEYTSM